MLAHMLTNVDLAASLRLRLPVRKCWNFRAERNPAQRGVPSFSRWVLVRTESRKGLLLQPRPYYLPPIPVLRLHPIPNAALRVHFTSGAEALHASAFRYPFVYELFGGS